MKAKIKNKESLINIITTLILQIVTIISGFIIPKIILSTFGSDVNGLVSSLKQFLSYITIVEGGVSGVITANLYKPLVEKDTKKINQIIKTADSFYKKIGLIYIVYSIILAIVYSLAMNLPFQFDYVFLLTIILSITLLIQYMFSLAYRGLLTADKKIYIISLVQIVIVLVNTIIAIIISKVYPSIHVLYLLSGLVFIVQPIVFGLYVKRNYTIIPDAKKDNKLIKERWNGFAINIASFIHNSTDISILTIFTNLSTVSIYSVYMLITTGLKQIINSIASSITPTIGQAYAKNNMKELYYKLDIYEYIVNFLVFFMFSIALLLITPFVLLYTKGITDANYNQVAFGVLLIISEMIYLIKLPHLNLAYSANKFKNITKPAFIEAIINLVVSIILVRKYGLIGVTIGTIIAMTYRLMFHIKYTKTIINRKQWIFYKKIMIFLVTSIIGLFISYFLIPLNEITIYSWISHAIIYSLLFLILFFIISILFFKNEMLFFYKYLKKGKNN